MGIDPLEFEEPDLHYSGLQLELPIGPLDCAPIGPTEQEQRPTPEQVLAEYLGELGVAQPSRVAGSLLREFGSISALLSASWTQLRRSVGFRLASTVRASRQVMLTALNEAVSKGPVI